MPKVFFEREEFLRTTTRGHRGSVSYGLVAFALSLFAFLPAQAVARPAAGHPDRSFGGDGTVSTKFPMRRSWANSVAIDSRGRIVAAGTAGGRSFALARYKPNGRLDRSFSADGRVRTNFPGSDTTALGVASDSRGRIVAAGYTGDFPDWDFALARYRRNGSLDGSFGAHGKVTTDLGMTDSASSVAIDSHNRIVVAGRTDFLPPCCGGTEAGDFALVRYDHRGTPDSSFGTAGKVITDFGGFDGASSVALDTRGRIVAAGSSRNLGDSSKFALARYDRHGQPDASFGGGGMLTTNFRGRYDQATSVAIDSRGRIVAAGNTADHRVYYGSAGSQFALARYGHHGALDHSFSGNGKVAKPHGNALSAAIDSRDRIVAAGTNDHRFALARYVG